MSNQKDYPLLFKSEEDIKRENRKRYEKARKVAKNLAKLLKEKYNAKVVWIFGSLNDPDRFNEWSDIDLAVQGVDPERFYAAVGAVTDLYDEFKIDLLDLDDCKDSILETVKREGKRYE